MILKFLDFQYVFVNVLLKISSNCMSGLFCIANLLEMGRKKKFFLNFYGFQTSPN